MYHCIVKPVAPHLAHTGY